MYPNYSGSHSWQFLAEELLPASMINYMISHEKYRRCPQICVQASTPRSDGATTPQHGLGRKVAPSTLL